MVDNVFAQYTNYLHDGANGKNILLVYAEIF